MSTVDAATFKAKADELLAKALAGDVTIIDQNGRRAVLMPCEGAQPDFQLFPNVDRVLQERLQSSGAEPTEDDWQALMNAVPNQ